MMKQNLMTDNSGTNFKNMNWESSYETDRAWIEIDREALASNVVFFKERLPKSCKLMPAVKAEAYGHGAVLIAKELNRLGIDAFCVACVEEAVQLREHGIQGEMLILGYTHPKQFPLLEKYDLCQTVVDYSYAQVLNQYGKGIKVHLGVDTGMHRLGERCENAERICQIFDMDNLQVEGIFTHLPADDTLDPEDYEFTIAQVKEFNQLLEILQKKGYQIPKVHLLASYGILNYPQFAGDYARVGIAMYGVLSTKKDTECWKEHLTPVLSLKSRVASVRCLHQGECAGYGMAFTASKEMKIATLAIGYADGLPRNLSNGIGSVLIKGHRAPIIGRICMDQTIVDVSDSPDIITGDVAVLIGNSGKEQISACDLAEQCGSITNEILSRMGSRLTRVYCDTVNNE